MDECARCGTSLSALRPAPRVAARPVPPGRPLLGVLPGGAPRPPRLTRHLRADRGAIRVRVRRCGGELGRLNGDRVARFCSPRDLGTALRAEGRVGPHLVDPHSPKLAARSFGAASDVADAPALLRLDNDRLVGP